MKNKKSIYILLPLVLLIWGTVMYQFFSFTNTDEEVISPTNEFSLKPIKIVKRDSFTINTNYRDPFLGKVYVAKKDSLPKKKKPAKVVTPLVWPTIQYKGIVSDTKDKVKISMLLINNRTCLMKKGETQNEVYLKDGDKESVYVKYKGELNLIMID